MPNLEMVYDVKNLNNPESAVTIKNAVLNLDGINDVDVDIKGKKVIVGFTPGLISVQAIKETIQDQGFEVI